MGIILSLLTTRASSAGEDGHADQSENEKRGRDQGEDPGLDDGRKRDDGLVLTVVVEGDVGLVLGEEVEGGGIVLGKKKTHSLKNKKVTVKVTVKK